MTEQSGPRELVRYAVGAERSGFDFLVSSDHYFPWLTEMGHAPNAWTMLGAVAQVTQRVELMTYVTCPTIRYHPAVVAQQAATLGVLSDGRFTLGLGSGEALNEHVVGRGWPSAAVRQDMLVEAIEIIRALHTGHQTTWAGEHFRIDSAKIWDLPDQGVPLAAAVSGPSSVAKFAPLVDHLISTEPEAELTEGWGAARREHGLPPSRTIGQIPISWDPDAQRAVERAHGLFRWFGGGWHVNADLPTPVAFDGASQFVRPEDVAQSIPCGPDLDAVVEAVRPFWEAGYTDIALVQVGDEAQQRFLDEVSEPLLAKLRAAAPAS